MPEPVAIEPNAMYSRRDLTRIYGARMAERICRVSRKVSRGRYMGFQILDAIKALADEYEMEAAIRERPLVAAKLRGRNHGISEGRAPW